MFCLGAFYLSFILYVLLSCFFSGWLAPGVSLASLSFFSLCKLGELACEILGILLPSFHLTVEEFWVDKFGPMWVLGI